MTPDIHVTEILSLLVPSLLLSAVKVVSMSMNVAILISTTAILPQPIALTTPMEHLVIIAPVNCPQLTLLVELPSSWLYQILLTIKLLVKISTNDFTVEADNPCGTGLLCINVVRNDGTYLEEYTCSCPDGTEMILEIVGALYMRVCRITD